jgi:N-acetylglucosaminyl-diphospho-decaprenol L-rhamnosyltransferase
MVREPVTYVSAVIVSYNVRELLLECIASLRADGVEHIVVVDNASADGSADAARSTGVEVLALDTNVGFGSGANRGVERTSTPYVIVCNPDLEFEAGTNKALTEVLDLDDEVGIVAPRIETPDGRLYPSARTFPDLVDAAGHAFLHFVWRDNPFSRRYKMVDWDHDRACDVDWVAGTYFVVRRSAWDQVGGFDEAFFMYLEDVDLCWRMKDKGWRTRYDPAATIVHAIGRSTDQTPYRMIAEHHRSLLRFAAKTMHGPRRAFLPVVAAALAVRTLLAWVQRWWRRKPHADH